VIRYNKCTSIDGKYYNDAIGGEHNFRSGNVRSDSDIYGNIASHSLDDGIEMEGYNRNVRIWGNVIYESFRAVATASYDMEGPLYVWRNIFISGNDAHSGGIFSKLRGLPGPSYFFHNSMVHLPGTEMYVGGIRDTDGMQSKTTALNNILIADEPVGHGDFTDSDKDNFLDYNLYRSEPDTFRSEWGEHMVIGEPVYDKQGEFNYFLAAGSPGVDDGVVIPNFNDGYVGSAPDIGALETGGAPLPFGPHAAPSSECGANGCEPGENCDNCPQDCPTPSGQVCCSGALFVGDCCTDSDCPSGQYCRNHECQVPGPCDGYCCVGEQTCPGEADEHATGCSGVCCSQQCEIIVDNGDPGFSTTGVWETSSYSNAYGSNSLWTTRDQGSTATWTINTPGAYGVYAWWTAGQGRVNQVTYMINHASGSDTRSVNQKLNGGQWNLLGSFTFESGGSVVLSDASSDPNSPTPDISDSVCADAIRFVVAECQPISITELQTIIDDWKAGNIIMVEVIQAINRWKQGC